MRVLLLLLMLTSGCASHMTMPGMRWDAERVNVVLDDSMSVSCLLSSEKALDWYANNGVDYLDIDYKSHDWIGFQDLASVTNTISIHVQEIATANVIGNTYRERDTKIVHHKCVEKDLCYAYYPLKSAGIVIEGCSTIVIAHEIGHALGLEHEQDKDNLMYFETVGMTMTLNDEQWTWIRKK